MYGLVACGSLFSVRFGVVALACGTTVVHGCYLVALTEGFGKVVGIAEATLGCNECNAL